jgi:NTP pyrophosphatase (non-canonical NTP hydrolase)
MADVLLYLVRLADTLDVDLGDAARRKVEINAAKYPIELSRGNATKHTKLVG